MKTYNFVQVRADFHTDEVGGLGVWRCVELEGVLRHSDRSVLVMGI